MNDVIRILILLLSVGYLIVLLVPLAGRPGQFRCAECGLTIRFRGIDENRKDALRQQMAKHVRTHQPQRAGE